MRRYTKALLLVFVALLYAGSANAYIVSVTGPTSAAESDVITVDLMMDTEGAAIYGYLMNLWYDPAELSLASDTFHPLPGSDSSSFYAYPDGWYITDIVFAGILGGVNTSLATLVFHVMNVAGSTAVDITPVLTTLSGTGGANFSGLTTVVPLSIQVPEPATTALVLSAIGTLALLGTRRGRAR